MLANVKIEQDKENQTVHRVFKDGKKIERVRAINFDISAGEIPIVLVEIAGGCNFEGMADIYFDYFPYTVKEACKILRDELVKYGYLYNGFISGIESSIKDQRIIPLPGHTEKEIAEKILSRIIGED